MFKFRLLAITFCLFSAGRAQALDIYQDDVNTVALRGYLNMLAVNTEAANEISDSGSRFGFEVERKIEHDWTIGAQVEFGLSFATNSNLSLNPSSQAPAGSDDDAVFSRLGNIFFQHDDYGIVRIGKQWSVYYDVVIYGDEINVWGSSGSLAANGGSDGGISGTGRAEQAITWRRSFGDWSVGLQGQFKDEAVSFNDPSDPDNPLNGEPVGTVGNGYGFSLTYNLGKSNFGITNVTADTELDGVFGNRDVEDKTTAIAYWYGKPLDPGLYVYVGYAQSENHDTDDAGQYFDAVGTELVIRYRLENGLIPLIGFNRVEENYSSYTGEYEMHFNFVGVEYNLEGVRGRLYSTIRKNDSTFANGDKNDDLEIAVGTLISFF
jgi:predicted porin